MTLNDLVPDVLARVEENEEGGPIFWQLTAEVLPALVDSMFEAALLTGTVQVSNVAVTLAADTTYFSLQNNAGIGVPRGTIAALRMKAPYTIRKVTFKGLGDIAPGWQNTPPDTQLRAWFPLGVSSFGVWPQYSVESQVIMDFIVSPTNAPRPYVTTLPVPFQEEFTDGFSMYAAAMLRMKELGAEAEEATTVMNEYMEKMKGLGMFQNRLDKLVLTRAYGGNAIVNRRTEV